MVDVKYKGKTEAIVKLKETIKFDRERRTIAGNHVKIFRVPSPKEISITEVVRCPLVKQDLMKMMLPHWQSSLPGCSLKRVTEGIELSGASMCVKPAMLELCKQVFKFDPHAISDVDNQRAKLLLSDRGQQQLQTLFSKAGIQAVLSGRDDQLYLTVTDFSKKLEASEILEKNVHRFEIPVASFLQEFLRSTECNQFIRVLQQNYAVSIEKGESTFVIEVVGDCAGEVQQQVQDKLKEHAQHTKEYNDLEEEDWTLLKEHHQAEVEALGCKNVDG